MPHTLILGITESGKTTLAVKLAQNYKKRGINVLVLEPFKSQKWNADFITDNANEFLDVVFTNKSCAIFIDESGDMIGRYNEAMNKLATVSRHYGHNSHFICQRATMINPTIRSQCSNIFLFKQSLDDAKILSKEYVCDDLLNSHKLRQGQYLAKLGIDSEVIYGRIF